MPHSPPSNAVQTPPNSKLPKMYKHPTRQVTDMGGGVAVRGLTIRDSVIKNFALSSSVTGMYLNYASNNDVHLYNVTFSDMTASGSTYGLI